MGFMYRVYVEWVLCIGFINRVLCRMGFMYRVLCRMGFMYRVLYIGFLCIGFM